MKIGFVQTSCKMMMRLESFNTFMEKKKLGFFFFHIFFPYELEARDTMRTKEI